MVVRGARRVARRATQGVANEVIDQGITPQERRARLAVHSWGVRADGAVRAGEAQLLLTDVVRRLLVKHTVGHGIV